jgi:predicted phage terminase large subunit-like protein
MRAAYQWVERRWPRTPHKILIEKSANGIDIITELKRELPGVLAIPVTSDKITRAMAASPPLEAGNIFVPGRKTPDAAGYQAPEWVAQLIEEAATLPSGRHDDQVDAYSQATNHARTHPPQRPAHISRTSKHHTSLERLALHRSISTDAGLASYLHVPHN